jgi:uncharacterized protein (TIGR02117 family)
MQGRWAKLILALACLWLPAMVAAAAPPAFAPPAGSLVYVIAGSWHTEIALPASETEGPLRRLAAEFPGSPYLIFGWGAHDFYMAPHPDLADALRAALPGPAVMLVIPLGVAPTAYLGPGAVWALPASRAGLARLSQYLWDDVAKDRGGAPVRAGPGPYPRSVFYVSTGTYDASHTCNTWTALALRAAGLPVTAAGVVFAGQLTGQLGPLSAAAENRGR